MREAVEASSPFILGLVVATTLIYLASGLTLFEALIGGIVAGSGVALVYR